MSILKKKFNGIIQSFLPDKKEDHMIFIFMLVLFIFGTIMLMSTNVGKTTSTSNATLGVLGKQIMYFLVGYGAYIFMEKRFKFSRFYESVAIIGLTFLMILLFFFPEVNGSHAWIQIKFISFQPSELVKPTMIILWAFLLYKTKKDNSLLAVHGKLWKRYLRLVLLFCGLIVLQFDIGTLSIVTMICFICFLIPDFSVLKRAQNRLKILFVVGIVLGTLFSYNGVLENIMSGTKLNHIAERISNCKNPYDNETYRDPDLPDKIYDEGYQPANALYGIASAGLFGKGLGNSTRKYGYLTQAENDYIFAIVIEETGIIGLSIIVVLYGLIIYRFLYYAFKTTEVIHKVVLIGVCTHLFMHFFLNVGGVISLIPFTGVPLLFISSGGSSLVSIMLSFGLAQNSIIHIKNKELKQNKELKRV